MCASPCASVPGRELLSSADLGPSQGKGPGALGSDGRSTVQVQVQAGQEKEAAFGSF